MDKEILAGIWIEETTTISFQEACELYHFNEDWLIEIIEQGLLNESVAPLKTLTLDGKTLHRIQAAWRLQQELDVNIPGVLLALDLLDELKNLRSEINILKRHMDW